MVTSEEDRTGGISQRTTDTITLKVCGDNVEPTSLSCLLASTSNGTFLRWS